MSRRGTERWTERNQHAVSQSVRTGTKKHNIAKINEVEELLVL